MWPPEPDLTMRPPLDEGRVLHALARHRVDYVLIGGLAARAHGATRRTGDIDICVSDERPNLVRLVAALTELDATFRDDGFDALPPLTVDSVSRMHVGHWRTRAGDVDVLFSIDGEPARLCYGDLRKRAKVFQIAGCDVVVASLQHMITSKRVAGRAHDLQALPELTGIQAAGPTTP
jgi:hypothetical protein